MKSCIGLKKKGSRLAEDHYRNRLENFRAIKKLFLEEIQIARQDWEFLVQEAENSGEGLSEGEMKKILLSKLTPETKHRSGTLRWTKKSWATGLKSEDCRRLWEKWQFVSCYTLSVLLD